MVMVGTTMVLARVLTPHDFGLVAMATILVSLVGPIRNFGLPSALVHQRRLSDRHVSEIFWLNFKLNALLAAAIGAMAPLLAWFFGEPRLVGMTLVLTLGFLVRGTANLQPGLLQRQMRFGLLSVVNTAALVAGAIAGIGYALWAGGYWALVVQQLTVACVETGLLWLLCPWKPASPGRTPGTRGQSVRGMLVFGRNTTLTRMVNEAGVQMDRILLGRFVGVEPLGLYQNALRWASVPATQLLQPLRIVAISGFSRLRDDPPQYRAYARNAFTVVLTLSLPTFTFLCIEARGFIRLLLGPQWIGAVPLFQILTIAMIFTAPDRVSKWVYLGEGRTLEGLYWRLIATAFLTIAMIAGLPWGTLGVAAGFCAGKALLAYPALWFCLRRSALEHADFWLMAWRPAIATCTAATAVMLLRAAPLVIVDFTALRLALNGVVFSGVFAATWLLLPGGLAITTELVEMLGLRRRGNAGSQFPAPR